MKLVELLQRITPLPWPKPCNGPIDSLMTTSQCEFQHNKFYERHAANVLPQLVEAAELFRYNRNNPEAHKRLCEALSLAEEIKDL